MKVIHLDAVCHLTSSPQTFRREIQLKPSHSASSWEGIGLSVTLCNSEVLEAWSYIARLSESAVQLTRADQRPGAFALWTSHLGRDARKWAVGQHLLVPRKAYRISWYDPDEDDRRSTVVDTKADAEAEIAEIEQSDGEDIKVTTTTAYEVGDTLAARWQQHFPHGGSVTSEEAVIEATNLYVALKQPKLDGIWWDEELNLDALSAPRGVILPHALERWHGQPFVD